ncbi:MAG: DUF7168 domain-containing protein [Bacillota bacterium]
MAEVTREKLIERVRKLMRLAEGTNRQGEAEAALLAAQKLLVEHGLSVVEIKGDGSRPEPEAVNDTAVLTGYALEQWKIRLATIVAHNFRCDVYLTSNWDARSQTTGRRRRELRFIGVRSDAEVAATVFQSAAKAAEHLCRLHLAERRHEPGYKVNPVRNAFFRGFNRGLDDKFREQVAQNNWALVLVKDKRVTTELARVLGPSPRTERARPLRANDAGAFAAGYSAGHNFETSGMRRKSLQGAAS